MGEKNKGLFELLDKGKAVIYGIIANFIFEIVNIKPNKVELVLIIILVFLIWVIISGAIASQLNKIKALEANVLLKNVIFDLIEVITYLGVFLVAQVLLHTVLGQININTNIGESLVGLFVLLLTAFTVLETVETLRIK